MGKLELENGCKACKILIAQIGLVFKCPSCGGDAYIIISHDGKEMALQKSERKAPLTFK